MAESPSHAFGQHLGNVLERLLLPELQTFCDVYGVYLDQHGERVGVRNGRKLTWTDEFGNSHDLDFVIEKGGSSTTQGRPAAFVEAAWRSYTKHSKNKVQEIQGAVLPIARKYSWDKPFLGAVLAGAFTSNSIEQLRTSGFEVVYLPTESVATVFSQSGIDINYGEATTDEWFSAKLAEIRAAGGPFEARVVHGLSMRHRKEIDAFLAKLESSVARSVDRVVILPLYGRQQEFPSLSDAANFLNIGTANRTNEAFVRFDVAVRYSNGDRIEGSFADRGTALSFLSHLG